MDDRVGGNAAASWLETAARDELLRFFLYLGVDMESVSDEDLVGQVDWAVAHLPNAVGTAYVKYCASAALPVRRRVFDVQVFQSRVDVSALNSSGAECGTVSAQVESDEGVSPRDTDSGRAPGDSRSEASRLQQPAGVPSGEQQHHEPRRRASGRYRRSPIGRAERYGRWSVEQTHCERAHIGYIALPG